MGQTYEFQINFIEFLGLLLGSFSTDATIVVKAVREKGGSIALIN